jgi:hypothetical protein
MRTATHSHCVRGQRRTPPTIQNRRLQGLPLMFLVGDVLPPFPVTFQQEEETVKILLQFCLGLGWKTLHPTEHAFCSLMQ